MNFILSFINLTIELLELAILARVILSWLRPNRSNFLVKFIFDTTEPVLYYARKITPSTGPVDFSPFVAFIGLQFIGYLINSLLIG